jgi:hypothetical protein
MKENNKMDRFLASSSGLLLSQSSTKAPFIFLKAISADTKICKQQKKSRFGTTPQLLYIRHLQSN